MIEAKATRVEFENFMMLTIAFEVWKMTSGYSESDESNVWS